MGLLAFQKVLQYSNLFVKVLPVSLGIIPIRSGMSITFIATGRMWVLAPPKISEQIHRFVPDVGRGPVSPRFSEVVICYFTSPPRPAA